MNLMNANKKLVSNTFYLLLNYILVTGLSFLFWLVAGKTLLPEEYGIVSTSINLAVLLSGVALFGLGMSLMKLIPEYLEKKQNKKISSLIRFSSKIVLISNLIIALLIFILSPVLAQILKVPISVIYITVIIMGVLSFSDVFNFILRGFQKMRKVAITEFIGRLVKVLIPCILIFFGIHYFGFLIGVLLGVAITGILRFKLSFLTAATEKINQKHIIYEYALPALITTLSWMLFLNGQYVILTLLKNPEVTGIFTIAMVLTTPLVIIPKTMSQALFPIISQLNVNHNKKRRQCNLIKIVFRYALLISLPLMIFIILFSKQIILIFARAEYLPAHNLFPILAIASIIYGCGNIFLSSIYAIGKTKIQRNIVIIASTIFLALSVLLTHLFSAIGMCTAYAISIFIIFVLSLFFIKKFLQFRLPWKDIGKLIISSIIIFSFLFYMIRITQGLIFGIILAIISGLIYLLLLIPLKFYNKQDLVLFNFIIKRLPILRKETKKILDYFSKFIDYQ